MAFQNPAVLLLLLLVPLAAAFITYGEWQRRLRLRLLGDVTLIGPLLVPADSARFWQKLLLWCSCVSCMIVALARPTWGLESSPVRQEGISVLLLLDVSNSMNAQDVAPSRLARAKLDAQAMLRQFKGHEFGLVLFAGSAFLQFPLTTDLASAEVFLQAASSDSISRQGTNLEAALQVALDGFRIVNGRKRIIILMSDGEDLEGDPLTLVAELANENITVYALGYGTASGAEIPLAGGGVKTDAVGTVVTTRLDDSELRRIAEQGGGGYWAVAEDGIASLVEQLRVHKPAALSSTASGKPVERFAVFLALALVFLSLDILLSEVRPRAA